MFLRTNRPFLPGGGCGDRPGRGSERCEAWSRAQRVKKTKRGRRLGGVGVINTESITGQQTLKMCCPAACIHEARPRDTKMEDEGDGWDGDVKQSLPSPPLALQYDLLERALPAPAKSSARCHAMCCPFCRSARVSCSGPVRVCFLFPASGLELGLHQPGCGGRRRVGYELGFHGSERVSFHFTCCRQEANAMLKSHGRRAFPTEDETRCDGMDRGRAVFGVSVDVGLNGTRWRPRSDGITCIIRA